MGTRTPVMVAIDTLSNHLFTKGKVPRVIRTDFS